MTAERLWYQAPYGDWKHPDASEFEVSIDLPLCWRVRLRIIRGERLADEPTVEIVKLEYVGGP